MSSNDRKPLTYYLGLRYPVQLVACEEGGYYVRIPDLPGCMSQGETAEEALANIEEARELWLETAHEAGDEIPLPQEERTYSGRFLVRVPASLHERLARAAEREGVSLNQFVVSLLAEGVSTNSVEARLARIEDCGQGVQRGLQEGAGAYDLRFKLVGSRPQTGIGEGRGRPAMQLGGQGGTA